jgi:putative SOS response-associated peptidase YedK
MCGRYTLLVTMDELMIQYQVRMPNPPAWSPRYNIAPTQLALAVVHDGRANRIGPLRWGLVPPSASRGPRPGGLINARAETLLEKPTFRGLVSRKRCVIPADGFYEWRRSGGGKQPMRIVMKDGAVFSMAGLYDVWRDAEGNKIGAFAVITTSPNELMADIHDRMPAILRPEDVSVWLNRGNQDPDELLPLLRPYPADRMRAYPVSPKVGNVHNDSPDLIEEQTEF